MKKQEKSIFCESIYELVLNASSLSSKSRDNDLPSVILFPNNWEFSATSEYNNAANTNICPIIIQNLNASNEKSPKFREIRGQTQRKKKVKIIDRIHETFFTVLNSLSTSNNDGRFSL
ncbi:hypothetical protein BpHYR1_009530 [Brachionus plicatilis]|uniref:Uncharacterized protein n=1 Tax=Brachionus plicatilis TaxID=10195 RepID=A0A3M7SU58_BRAPC|nr:hypothetical protein BpHYR1_009530 [Brachionus plicatilis]